MGKFEIGLGGIVAAELGLAFQIELRPLQAGGCGIGEGAVGGVGGKFESAHCLSSHGQRIERGVNLETRVGGSA